MEVMDLNAKNVLTGEQDGDTIWNIVVAVDVYRRTVHRRSAV